MTIGGLNIQGYPKNSRNEKAYHLFHYLDKNKPDILLIAESQETPYTKPVSFHDDY